LQQTKTAQLQQQQQTLRQQQTYHLCRATASQQKHQQIWPQDWLILQAQISDQVLGWDFAQIRANLGSEET
jgi:hypothetical protein